MSHLRTPPLVLALLLSACSSGQEAERTANQAAAVIVNAATAADAPTASDVSVSDSHATPKPSDLKTFKDWIVGCDNQGRCQLASLGPEGSDFPASTALLTREAGPAGAWTIRVAERDGTPGGIALGGRTLAPSADHVTGAQAADTIAQLVDAPAFAAINPDGRTVATISLAGMAAALRYVDAAQGRVQTVTASVAKGARSASIVPPAPAEATVIAVTPGGVAARPTARQIAEMRRLAQCEDVSGTFGGPESFALGGSATLVLLPCSSGAYNLSQSLFIIKGDTLAPAKTDALSGFTEGYDPPAVAEVVNGAFENGVLTSYAKGRGLGDCGIGQRFVWDGAMLRLVEQTEMTECRGNTDTIATWRARVVRR